MRDRRKPFNYGQLISKICLAVVGFIFVIPFIWMFFSSLKPSTEVLLGGSNLFGSEVRWSNYAEVFSTIPFARILANTFFIAGMGALIAVTVSVLSAYAFSRLEFPGRGALFAVFIATLMLPIEVLVIPLFIGANSAGLVNSYPAIILPFAFGAFGTFLLRQFLLSLPPDYEEAARIDGANQWQLLRHVIVPLLRGPISIVAAFTFIDYWNAFLWPLIIITDPAKAPLQLGLSMFSGERGTDWGPLMAATSIAVLASLSIVVFLQRQIAKGINIGGFGGR
ncbi:carbohydrate ABC transporter permease [Tessaracoccus defluvii]|uniref:Carbohydrate ABC transporter permease n=1 Tax=Tessaracoccus defluvii TaxID=1285901 RepID=A0A7H0H7C5_9ACTN|nr:carbohydrate ABC transporter permease [Tessaracoccus defluvii]QNP56441.1 carbohydrate ABC transporter permease [Tessaracoccus defluvii]